MADTTPVGADDFAPPLLAGEVGRGLLTFFAESDPAQSSPMNRGGLLRDCAEQAHNKKTRHEGGFSLKVLDPCLRRDEQR
jgi:hypothetical protein